MQLEEGEFSGVGHIDVPALPDDFDMHLIEYRYEGGTWLLEVPAKSPEDAIKRLGVASEWGNYLGVGVMKIPANQGFWVPLACWVRNLFGR